MRETCSLAGTLLQVSIGGWQALRPTMMYLEPATLGALVVVQMTEPVLMDVQLSVMLLLN